MSSNRIEELKQTIMFLDQQSFLANQRTIMSLIKELQEEMFEEETFLYNGKIYKGKKKKEN